MAEREYKTSLARRTAALEYHYQNRDRRLVQMREYGRADRLALKADVLGHYGGACACCGETELIFLSLEHVGGGGKAHRAEMGGGEKVYRDIRKRGYPPGFEALCHNCNQGRHINGGVCPHEQHALRLVSGDG